jgi:hypothetical protein
MTIDKMTYCINIYSKFRNATSSVSLAMNESYAVMSGIFGTSSSAGPALSAHMRLTRAVLPQEAFPRNNTAPSGSCTRFELSFNSDSQMFRVGAAVLMLETHKEAGSRKGQALMHTQLINAVR